jgi:hypothetical protein
MMIAPTTATTIMLTQMISPTTATTIMLTQSLAYQIFIAPGLSSIRSAPIRFFHLQYVIAGYVNAGYTVL